VKSAVGSHRARRHASNVQVIAFIESFVGPQWSNEIPIGGEPEDLHDVIASYNAWLVETEIPRLLLHATPGTLTPAPVVEWCRDKLRKLKHKQGNGVIL